MTKTTTTTEPTITIPVSEFVDLCLGRDYWTDRPIPREIAELLVLVTGNHLVEHGFWIQFENEFGNPLPEPHLWYYRFWHDVAERRARQKLRSEQDRQQRFIFEANVKMVARAVTKFCSIDGSGAEVCARKLILKNNIGGLLLMGVEKLYTTIEEIP